MKIDSLPPAYVAPSELHMASNVLINVKAIIDFKGNIPLLIGDGKRPHIWLYIPANKEGTEWYPLIKNNFSTNPRVLVITGKNSVTIATPDGNVIECEKQSNGVINVIKLDLRPFGLDLVAEGGEDGLLTIMGQTFTSSTFSNLGAMVGVGNA